MEVKIAANKDAKIKNQPSGCLTTIVGMGLFLILSGILTVVTMATSDNNPDINPYKVGLSLPIGEEEAMETCCNILAQASDFFPVGESPIFVDGFPSPRDSIERGVDAWHIKKEGTVKLPGTKTWESAMFYCEIPFERVDLDETYSVKNVRKIDCLGP
jgi:hypothetical protein